MWLQTEVQVKFSGRLLINSINFLMHGHDILEKMVADKKADKYITIFNLKILKHTHLKLFFTQYLLN